MISRHAALRLTSTAPLALLAGDRLAGGGRLGVEALRPAAALLLVVAHHRIGGSDVEVLVAGGIDRIGGRRSMERRRLGGAAGIRHLARRCRGGLGAAFE